MYKRIIYYLLIVILFFGCSRQADTDVGKISTVVSLLPYKNFVEVIGGQDVSVNVLIPSAASPHTFELTSVQMRRIAESDVYFKVGGKFNFEKEILENISEGQSSLNIIDCSQGINFINDNPHIWLGPPQVKQISKNILTELVLLRPEREKYYLQNYNNFITELDSIDNNLKQQLRSFSQRNFLVYHEAWIYFAEHYGLNEIAIEIEGKEPSAQHMQEIVKKVKEIGLRNIYISPNQNPEAAITIAHEIGAEIDTLNTLPENYLSYLNEIISKLKRDFR